MINKEGIFRIVSKLSREVRKFQYDINKKEFLRFTDRYFVTENNDKTSSAPINPHSNLCRFDLWNASLAYQKKNYAEMFDPVL